MQEVQTTKTMGHWVDSVIATLDTAGVRYSNRSGSVQAGGMTLEFKESGVDGMEYGTTDCAIHIHRFLCAALR